MTQKEYKENIEILENEIKSLKQELENAKNKYNLNQDALESYYIINEDLRREKEYNKQNCELIQKQSDIIEHYEKILARFSCSYNI